QTAEKAANRLAKRCADMGGVIENAYDADLPARLREELADENLPIVSFASAPDASTTAARFDLLGELLGSLGTRKLVVLRRRGGLGRSARSPAGAVAVSERGLSVVNLRTDLASLREPRVLPAD